MSVEATCIVLNHNKNCCTVRFIRQYFKGRMTIKCVMDIVRYLQHCFFCNSQYVLTLRRLPWYWVLITFKWNIFIDSFTFLFFLDNWLWMSRYKANAEQSHEWSCIFFWIRKKSDSYHVASHKGVHWVVVGLFYSSLNS